ncbi:MAG: hypothetical protein JST17_10400 [Bacteroidetes bacterium]|nr:hypothetical protein [Bacteroidota bacterium]MBS1930305.1 hypothetical protein [Bacteroidota bacterium]
MKIWCLRMDKAVVEDFLSSGGWNHKMILRFSMTGLSAVNGNLDVYAYWTKNQKQKESRKTVVLKTDTASVNLDSQKEYVLGNNYLRMKILKKYIKEIRKVKDFEYLRFTPIENSGQIAFSVQAIGSDGKVISLPKSNNITNGECITNPSPPAKPDGLMQ